MLSPRSYDTLFGPKHQDDLTYKCHRLTKPLNASLPVPPIANSSSSILSDVAIGIPVALEWVMNGRPDVSDTSMRTVQKLCAGEFQEANGDAIHADAVGEELPSAHQLPMVQFAQAVAPRDAW